MKKIMLILTIFTLILLKITKCDSLLLKEINIFKITTKFIDNDTEIEVGKTFIDVKNIGISNGKLYIEPLNEFQVPISGVITKITSNNVEISTSEGIVSISHNGKCKYRLYQYYNCYDNLLNATKVIIDSNLNIYLISIYRINNEKI